MTTKNAALLFLVLLLPAVAFAAPKVILFGGAASQKGVLDKCFPNFENYGYPADGAVAGVIKKINDNPDQEYIVAGHSSGAKYSNMVGQGNLKNPDRIKIISLDGFAPRSVPKSIKNRICWNAKGGTTGRIQSRNYGSMSTANNCSEVKTKQNSTCSTVWCMHFAMMNHQVPSNLDQGGPNHWVTAGYKGCSPNVDWAK